MVTSAGQRYVGVSTDTIGVPMSVTDHLQAGVQSRFGVPPQQLLLGATHTHRGPVLIDQPNTYITHGIAPTTWEDQLVRAYTSALETRVIELIGTLGVRTDRSNIVALDHVANGPGVGAADDAPLRAGRRRRARALGDRRRPHREHQQP
jgi:hypothetical protein